MKPQQRVSSSIKNTPEWKENNMHYIYKNCSGRGLSKSEITKLYRMAAGYLDPNEYLFATDPLGVKSRPALSGSPAGEITNMDMISPILMLMMGEKTKRPNQYQVFAKNSDFPSEKATEQMNLWIQNVHQMFVNEMIKLGVYVPGQTDEQGQPIKEPDSPEELQMKLASMSDWMAVQGQEALDYIRYFNELDRNFRKGFYDWLVTASVFSYKDVRYDDTIHDIVPVTEIEWIKGPNVDFIEDAQAVKRTQFMTFNQIIDNFRDIDGFNEDVMKDLEQWGNSYREASTQKMFSATEVFYQRMFGNQGMIATNGDDIEVCHMVWKSFQKQLKVSGTNVLGQQYEYTYDEDYIPLEGETVKESWISIAYEGYMIGGKHILGVQPIPISRVSMSNESQCKLPYNGRIFHSREVLSKSVVAKLEPFQKNINVAYHHLKKVMNKNKDKLTFLPLSMIPDKPGWDELTTLYYADTTGFLFIDDSDPRTIQSLQYIKTLDMALSQYIEYIQKIIAQWKADAEEMVGVNRQRKGESMASDAVGNNQQATIRSVLTTEELFVEYDEFEEKELQGLLDISKYAFVKGKKASYVSSDGKIKYLDINPESYPNIDHGVFVKSGGIEGEKLREFKQSAFAFAQNQMKPSLVAKVVNTDNLAKLVIELEQAEQQLEQAQQAQAQAEQQAQQQEVMSEAKIADDELNFKYYKVDADNLTKREIALIAPAPTDNSTELTKANVEREWMEIERDKVVIKAQAETYKADMSYKTAKVTASKRPKSS